MKIKILWGFVGNGQLLGTESNKVKAGMTFEDADDEYAHTLIGKGLAVELDANGKPRVAKPKNTKPVAPSENKAGTAAAEKVVADQSATDNAADSNAVAGKDVGEGAK